VCRMEVKETRSNKKARLAGVDGTPAPAAPSKQYDDSDSEYIDSDEEVKRAKNKLKVTVYYINPCYFVDCVRYRIWRIKVRSLKTCAYGRSFRDCVLLVPRPRCSSRNGRMRIRKRMNASSVPARYVVVDARGIAAL
jgi:hypothetical protein